MASALTGFAVGLLSGGSVSPLSPGRRPRRPASSMGPAPPVQPDRTHPRRPPRQAGAAVFDGKGIVYAGGKDSRGQRRPPSSRR
ncbi:hypothetical protein [Dactylosporangium sp. NPDC000521]|uniref:hypothetical protein n=1 Tax=Dactylosporangium sp. NPDC000521 TaxID=3363975 RepID=UPI0036736F7A